MNQYLSLRNTVNKDFYELSNISNIAKIKIALGK